MTFDKTKCHIFISLANYERQNESEKSKRKKRKEISKNPNINSASLNFARLTKREIKSWATVRDKSNASSLSFGRRH